MLLNTRKPAVQQVKYDYDDFRKIQGSLAKVNTGGSACCRAFPLTFIVLVDKEGNDECNQGSGSLISISTLL